MRRFVEGTAAVAERLLRDLLYYVAIAPADSDQVREIKRVYDLDRACSSDGNDRSGAAAAGSAVACANPSSRQRNRWNKFCAGAAVALPQFDDQTAQTRQPHRRPAAIAHHPPARRDRRNRTLAAQGSAAAQRHGRHGTRHRPAAGGNGGGELRPPRHRISATGGDRRGAPRPPAPRRDPGTPGCAPAGRDVAPGAGQAVPRPSRARDPDQSVPDRAVPRRLLPRLFARRANCCG
ncbi:MAG: hypothetical protein MZW92_63865 [Comamonadaceae bacterium]|nr:hypothetical protein [Comamonadaceae bacterium]